MTKKLWLNIFYYTYDSNDYKISNLVGTVRRGTDATHPFFMLFGGYLVDQTDPKMRMQGFINFNKNPEATTTMYK